MSSSPNSIFIGPDASLTCPHVELFVSTADLPAVWMEGSEEQIAASYRNFLRHRANGVPIYGSTTGFGPHVVSSAGTDETQGAALIAHLGAGYGPLAPHEVVRAAMLLRLHTVGQGYSGIRPDVAASYLAFVNSGIAPCVPETGSVGASGDLVPLSHIARVFMGEGEAFYEGNRLPASVCLRLAKLTLTELTGRDALALVNGTSFLTAYAALALSRAIRLTYYAEQYTGWLYRLLGAQSEAIHPRIMSQRMAQGMTAGTHIQREAERFGAYTDETRPLQEVYSLRCAPQVLGACWNQIHHVRGVLETEMKAVDDNPLITEDAVLHGGNFHGQAVGFAADSLNAAITQIAVLAERQIALLCTPSRHNDFAPLLLAYEPGRDSGLAGAQLTATALLAEMRGACQQFATSSIPTNADNQDVVPMATLAAQSAYRQTERLAGVLSVLHIAACQLHFLRGEGKAVGRTSPPPPGFPLFEPLRADRALHADIERIAKVLLHCDTELSVT